MSRTRHIIPILFLLAATPALAGPPYVTDDAEPTDDGHFEIYAFNQGTNSRGDTGGESGIDFNFGGGENLQLTAVVPLAYDAASGRPLAMGIGNIELAAKYKFLDQKSSGWDIAVFPRVFLPSLSGNVGDGHASFLLPFWAEKDWDDWSTFGGGGCALNNGGGSKDYCLFGWALTRKIAPGLAVGAEIYHQTADMRGGRDSTAIGAGAVYDLSDNYHLMASYGPGIENAAATDRYSWYVALLTTF